MPFDANGKWIAEDAAVQKQLAPIIAQDSAVMRQAGAAGARSANRRGLGNSTMGIGAGQSEMLKVAVPMASQNASQISGMNQAEMGNQNSRDINAANLAAAERERQLAALTSLTTNSQQAIAQTLNNHEIPSGTRAAVQSSINAQTAAAIAAMERLYGTSINWGRVN